MPNGGLSTFGSIITTGFGFTNLQVVLLQIPIYAFSVLYFVLCGQVTSRKKDMRIFFMMFSSIPPLIGFLMMSFLPNDDAHRWSKWGGYFMTVVFVITLFMAWTLIPSNTAGRTKRTLTSSFTFVGYCVGNMCGSQIFKSSDAPRYLPGTVGCAVCFGLQFFLIVSWRLVYMSRNRKTRRRLAAEGISEEERIARGKALGEKDMTDFENPYVSEAPGRSHVCIQFRLTRASSSTLCNPVTDVPNPALRFCIGPKFLHSHGDGICTAMASLTYQKG